MKYEFTESFENDFGRLSPEEQRLFRDIVPAFNRACEAFRADPGSGWPASMNVHPMKGWAGIWEMTWSHAGPDGRATFEWCEIDGELGVRWRRVGNHGIYQAP